MTDVKEEILTSNDEHAEFSAPKAVPRHGRGFIRPVIFQLSVCAALAAVLYVLYLTAPEVYEFMLERLRAAVGA